MAAVKAKKPTSKLKASKKNKVNKWLIISGVAVVAILGAVVVRYSSAAIHYTFTKYSSSMYNPYGAKIVTFKAYDRTYNIVPRGQTIRTIVSSGELNMATDLCAHVINRSGTGTTFTIEQFVPGTNGDLSKVSYKSKYVAPHSTNTVCTAKKSIKNTVLQLSHNSTGVTGGAGVWKFYSEML